MRCPYCDSDELKVIDSRAFVETNSIKRRRECIKCEKRFTTYEKIERNPIYVVKKNNSREKFNKEKLLKGLERATNKRDITRDELENFIDNIEKLLQNSLKNEISTRELGELVLERLKELDVVAYIRFASVYKKFDDIKSFIELIENMKKEKKWWKL